MMKISYRVLKTKKFREKAYNLRHEIFTKELGWTGSQIKEYDKYDKGSIFLGLFYNDGFCGFLRLIAYDQLWMIDSSYLFPKEDLSYFLNILQKSL